MSIKVIEASINSTIQDLGRKNYAKLGIARSGVMDELSLRIANILLGNKQDEAGLVRGRLWKRKLFLHKQMISGRGKSCRFFCFSLSA